MSNVRDIGNRLGVDWNEVDINEFRLGLKVEGEHADVTGGNILTTARIALAHLREMPDYYTRLARMEKGLCGTRRTMVRNPYLNAGG